MTEDERLRYEELLAAVKYLRERLAEMEAARGCPHCAHSLRSRAKPIKPRKPIRKTSGGLLMPYGKHKGTPVCDLPVDYARWLLDRIRASVQENKAFGHPHEPVLAAALMAVVHGEDVLNEGVGEAIKEYRGWTDCVGDYDEFFDWLLNDKTDGRKVIALWLGIDHVLNLKARQDAKRGK